jgi:hypothetical protein
MPDIADRSTDIGIAQSTAPAAAAAQIKAAFLKNVDIMSFLFELLEFEDRQLLKINSFLLATLMQINLSDVKV